VNVGASFAARIANQPPFDIGKPDVIPPSDHRGGSRS
jgi:hypothetical protein